MTAKTPSSTGQEMGNRATLPWYRRAIPFAIAAAALVVCLLAYIIWHRPAPQNPIRIAVVAPLSGLLERRGKEALDAVNLFDEVNRQGGVRGHPLELISYDDVRQFVRTLARVQRTTLQPVRLSCGGGFGQVLRSSALDCGSVAQRRSRVNTEESQRRPAQDS